MRVEPEYQPCFLGEKKNRVQVVVIPPALGFLHLNTPRELLQLELNHRMFGVAASVVLCQNGRCSVRLAARSQPSRRFRDEPAARKDENGREDLQSQRQAESDLAGLLGSGVGYARGEDTTGVEDCNVSTSCRRGGEAYRCCRSRLSSLAILSVSATLEEKKIHTRRGDLQSIGRR